MMRGLMALAARMDLTARALRLEADVHNSRALNLYRRHGFYVHDRYLMTKWIAPSC